MSVERINVEEAHRRMHAQKPKRREDIAFKCPMCGTVQNGQSLIDAKAGKNLGEVEKYLGFSCVGRWTQAGPPRRKPDGKPCNWTLGGLFQLHKLEVEMPNGIRPSFEIASPEEAQSLTESQQKLDSRSLPL